MIRPYIAPSRCVNRSDHYNENVGERMQSANNDKTSVVAIHGCLRPDGQKAAVSTPALVLVSRYSRKSGNREATHPVTYNWQTGL